MTAEEIKVELAEIRKVHIATQEAAIASHKIRTRDEDLTFQVRSRAILDCIGDAGRKIYKGQPVDWRAELAKIS